MGVEMHRFVSVWTMVLFCALLAGDARGEFFADFETPPYTAGTLNTQQGWFDGNNGNSPLTIVPTPSSPSANPTSGSQSLFGHANAFARHSLTSISADNDVEQISFLTQVTPLNGGTSNILTLDVAKASNGVSYVSIHANHQTVAPGQWVAFSPTAAAGDGHAFAPITLGDWYHVTVTMTYSTQSYVTTVEDVTAGTAPVSSGALAFLTAAGTIPASTPTNMLLRGLAGSGNASDVGVYFDDIHETPEPAALCLVGLAGIGLLQRKRRPRIAL
jgi:hypothetical protein